MYSNFWRDKLIKELERTRHSASGKLIRSIKVAVETTKDGYILKLEANDYVNIINKRFNPPYSPGSGADHSSYIEGLIGWAGKVKPSLSKKEQLSFAFATARKAKNRRTKGHPTRNPLFGTQRLNFLGRVFDSKTNQREFAKQIQLPKLDEKPINIKIEL